MIEHAGTCEQGPVRPNNEDCIIHHHPDDAAVRTSKGVLFAVADGVGGSRAGEVASSEATKALVSIYYANGKRPGRALQEAFSSANLHVYDLGQARAEYRRMETTLSALVLHGSVAYIGHIGDSRIYVVRNGEIRQLTRDHSEVDELVRMQLITAEDARHHPRRNIITRSLGSEPMIQPEFRQVAVDAGDIFVACTDGLWEPVEDAEIAETVTSYPPDDACRILIDLAIERGTADNLSLHVVRVIECEEPDATAAESRPGPLARVLGLFGKERKGA